MDDLDSSFDPERQQRRLFGPEKSREYRRQQKAQRKELLRQEAVLLQKLTTLQLLKKEELYKIDATRSHSYLLLRDLAKRLLEERRIAEARQQQLIGLINNQNFYINTIRDTVGRRLSTAMALVRSPYGQRIGVPTGPETYALYLQELDAGFQITNDVFQAYGVLFAREARSVHKQMTNGVEEYFSGGSKAVLPMPPLEAGMALWDFSSQYYSNKEGFVRIKDSKDPDNTRIESFVESSALQSGKEVKIRQHFIARRFYHDNRFFMTWQVISEGMGVFNGLRADEMGWCRLEASSDPMEPGTVIETCVCRFPIPSSDTTRFVESEANDFHLLIRQINEMKLDNVVSSAETDLLLGNMLLGDDMV